jgi:hypothetical protein
MVLMVAAVVAGALMVPVAAVVAVVCVGAMALSSRLGSPSSPHLLHYRRPDLPRAAQV